jgi:hypothetical protein
MTRYEALLQKNQEHTLSDTERTELTTLRVEGDRFMLLITYAPKPQPFCAGAVIQSFILRSLCPIAVSQVVLQMRSPLSEKSWFWNAIALLDGFEEELRSQHLRLYFRCDRPVGLVCGRKCGLLVRSDRLT